MRNMALAAAAAFFMTGAASADPIYSNTFGSNAAGFTGATALATTPTGESYLILYNGGSTPGTGVTTLSLAPGATGLSLTFDLYAIGSLDGNGQAGGGPDPFIVSANGVELFDYNVANYSGDTQNYSGNPATSGAGFDYAPRTGAIVNGSLGYGTGDYGDATYLVTLALPDGTTAVTFAGDTNEGLGNENYGIDNVVVTGVPMAAGVPEPASWATMIGGFGLIGGALRRSRHGVAARAFAAA